MGLLLGRQLPLLQTWPASSGVGWGTGMGVQKAPPTGSSWPGVLRDLGGARPQGWTGLDLPSCVSCSRPQDQWLNVSEPVSFFQGALRPTRLPSPGASLFFRGILTLALLAWPPPPSGLITNVSDPQEILLDRVNPPRICSCNKCCFLWHFLHTCHQVCHHHLSKSP